MEFRAVNAWVHKCADTAVMYFVVVDDRASSLHAQGDIVRRDVIMCDSDSAYIVHADADKVERFERPARRVDGIVVDMAVLGADSERAILCPVGHCIVRYRSILRADDGNVDAREALHRESGNRN